MSVALNSAECSYKLHGVTTAAVTTGFISEQRSCFVPNNPFPRPRGHHKLAPTQFFFLNKPSDVFQNSVNATF
jgi:hypothetical protein